MNIKFTIFAAIGLTALFLSPASSQVINACLTRAGALTSVTVDAFPTCPPGATPISWNIQGSPGPQGEKGDQGEQGPAGPPADGDTEKLIFATETVYPANLGGLEGADDKCQAAAEEAGLQGRYHAFLRDNLAAVDQRMTKARVPYKNLDGEVFANDMFEFLFKMENRRIFEDEPEPPFRVTNEFGQSIAGVFWKFPGRNRSGVNQFTFAARGETLTAHAANNSCNNWNQAGPGFDGTAVQPDAGFVTDIREHQVASCNSTLRLLCVQQ